jgi:pyruvate formate-lyase activating enzyme-like uncharacterized protein
MTITKGLSEKIAKSQADETNYKAINPKLYKIELALEKKVIFDIKKRQSNIPGLKVGNFGYTATWGEGELTPGCKGCCLQGKWTQIRTTTKCNLSCPFCYYFGQKKSQDYESIPADIYKIGMGLYDGNDVRMLVEVQGKKLLNGVAWLHFEPLMETNKMLSLMKFLHKKGLHQWLYTNGLLATEENLRKLADAGLDEIRFNLAATNCSDAVIKNMKHARRYFKYLCIESPMFTQFFNSFMKKKNAILNTGVDHIHFAELQLFPKTKNNFKGEGMFYRYKRGYVSPIKSRQLTYDIFETAAREKWENVVLHDCSNETKFFRGAVIPYNKEFGRINYFCKLNLDKAFYISALSYL